MGKKDTEMKNKMEETGQDSVKESKKWTKEEIRAEVISWIKMFIFVFVFTFILRKYVIVSSEIPSTSMENLIEPGDRIIGFRLAYLFEEPKRYDIVIFKYPVDESQGFIKRIIGMPGETVEIREGKIYIDGSEEPLQEDYLKEEWTVANDGYVFQVPEDSYLLLGDNRNVSMDARYWANEALETGVAATENESMKYSYVSRDKILGKAEFKYWRKFAMLR